MRLIKQYNIVIEDDELTPFLILLIQARQVLKTLPMHSETERITELASRLINETLPHLKAFETGERDILILMIMEMMKDYGKTNDN